MKTKAKLSFKRTTSKVRVKSVISKKEAMIKMIKSLSAKLNEKNACTSIINPVFCNKCDFFVINEYPTGSDYCCDPENYKNSPKSQKSIRIQTPEERNRNNNCNRYRRTLKPKQQWFERYGKHIIFWIISIGATIIISIMVRSNF